MEPENTYYQLMENVNNSEAFYFVDQETKQDTFYRTFSYRLASYSDFLLPYSREMRGISFEIDGNGNPLRFVSLPFHKFFNLHENPFVENLNLEDSIFYVNKEDGSLISTFLDVDNELKVKSKTSFQSFQAQKAQQIIDNNDDLKKDLAALEELDYTVLMEYVSPENRIVLSYPGEDLKILFLRNKQNFQYYLPFNQEISLVVSEEFKKRIASFYEKSIQDHDQFIQNVAEQKHFEGYVIGFPDSGRGIELVKLKTEWYRIRHHLKDSINNLNALFEAIINEDVDDIKAEFYDDPETIEYIEDKEKTITQHYNHMVDNVEKFYENHRFKGRKEYAILAKENLGDWMGLAMKKYEKSEPDYKGFFLKKKNRDKILNQL